MLKISMNKLSEEELEKYCFFIPKDLKSIFATNYSVITNFYYSKEINNYIGCYLVNDEGKVFIIEGFNKNDEILLKETDFNIELFKDLLINEIKLPSYYWLEYDNSLIASYFINGFVKEVKESKNFKELFSKFNKKMYDESITQQTAIYNLTSINYETKIESEKEIKKKNITAGIVLFSIIFSLLSCLYYFEMYFPFYVILFVVIFNLSIFIYNKFSIGRSNFSGNFILKNKIEEKFKNKEIIIIDFNEGENCPEYPLFIFKQNLKNYPKKIMADFIYVEGGLFKGNKTGELILSNNDFEEIKKSALLELKEDYQDSYMFEDIRRKLAKELENKLKLSNTLEELINSYKV